MTTTIKQIYETLGDGELMRCMEEITELKITGELKSENSKCREVKEKLEEILGKGTTHAFDFNIQNLLQEMANRWYKNKKYELENFPQEM